MIWETFRGILIPFLGTSIGAASVFFLRGEMNSAIRRGLQGFAAGVMLAASVWSLLLPAIDLSAALGPWAFVPAAVGFWVGVAFLLLLDKWVPNPDPESRGGTMLTVAVTLHNIPEGMAVGVIYAGYLTGQGEVTALAALSLALGVALQNIPEGAIISLPLKSGGMDRTRAFLWGVGSGAVEPLAALATVLCAALVTPLLPYLLSFAAGAMVIVVVEELIPETSAQDPHFGAAFLTLGFTLMMALDVALG